MWKAWITITWRNFAKYKSFSLLNVAGLSLGIASLITISLYVFDELQYDKFHQHAERIYRVTASSHYDASETHYATTATPLAEAIRKDIPDVEFATRLFERQATIQIIDGDSLTTDQKYLEDNFYLADPDILNIFSFTFLKGNPKTALAFPHQVIITRKIANKYFGSVEKAIGRQLLFEGRFPLVVSGVVENFPDQSSHDIDLVAHFENYFAVETPEIQEYLRQDWLYNPLFTYVLLKTSADPAAALEKIQALNATYADERVHEHMRYGLQPLTDVHLFSDFTYASQRNAIRYVYIFSAIGFLILIIACINFINLSTVHSMRRAKEIGIRKVVGAMKRNLAFQFLGESALLVLLSFALAVATIYFMLPMINMVTAKNFTVESLINPRFVVVAIMILLMTAAAAGVYPAFYITKFNPLLALKGLKDKAASKSHLVRRMLVVIQFTASMTLIVITVVIFQQIKFMQETPLGFQKEFMLTVPLFSSNPNSILGGGVDGQLRGRMNAFEAELLNQSVIEAVTVSSVLPGDGITNALVTTDKIQSTDNLFVPIISVDYDFLNTYRMPLVSGRSFTRAAGTDHLQSFIANEKAVKTLGLGDPERAIGARVNALGKNGTIVGVVRDYHFEGLQQPLRPLLMEVSANKFTVFSLRIHNQNIPVSIDRVKAVWNRIFPEKVFEYRFLDQQLDQAYEREQRFGTLINLFSGLTIFISALGLFGLAAFLAVQKQKEAGIRKVLGASTTQVFYSLSREFIEIMSISVLLSVPMSIWVANSWLDDFANRIDVDWIPFALAFCAIVATVFVSTAYQTLKTASVNPVQTLRSE